MESFGFTAQVRLRSNGKQLSSRHFVTLPKEISDKIRTIALAHPRKGRGSVKVEAMIGYLKRKTSIFPENKSGCYILPLKKEIRTQLQIEEGDEVWVEVNLLV